VSTTPDGLLDFRNDSGRTGERSVQLVVSDGRADGRGAVTVRVAKQGTVPLRADPFPVSGYAGKAFTVEPLDHVRGGNGTVTLTSVSSASGLTVTPSYDAGTFRVQGERAGDHQLEYTVTDGVKTSSGIVRVTVLAPPDASTAPITTPKTVFVNTLSSKDTDVTATDIDPAGGVLLVTALESVGFDAVDLDGALADPDAVPDAWSGSDAPPIPISQARGARKASRASRPTRRDAPEPDAELESDPEPEPKRDPAADRKAARQAETAARTESRDADAALDTAEADLEQAEERRAELQRALEQAEAEITRLEAARDQAEAASDRARDVLHAAQEHRRQVGR